MVRGIEAQSGRDLLILSVRAEARPQGLLAIYELLYGCPHGFKMQRPAQMQRDRFIVSAGCFISHVGADPDLLLTFGSRRGDGAR